MQKRIVDGCIGERLYTIRLYTPQMVTQRTGGGGAPLFAVSPYAIRVYIDFLEQIPCRSILSIQMFSIKSRKEHSKWRATTLGF